MHSRPAMIAMGKPRENRFIAGETRLSRPKQNCSRLMQNTRGRDTSTAAENTQPRDCSTACSPL
ncbi:hypothetical protein D9M69_689370 [compost metagenome]